MCVAGGQSTRGARVAGNTGASCAVNGCSREAEHSDCLTSWTDQEVHRLCGWHHLVAQQENVGIEIGDKIYMLWTPERVGRRM